MILSMSLSISCVCQFVTSFISFQVVAPAKIWDGDLKDINYCKISETGFLYLTAENKILKYCFCQQLYWYLMHVHYIPTVHISFKIFAWKADLLLYMKG